MIEKEFQGKWALVTGTNRGIGRAIIEKLASKGANIFAHARIQTENFEADMKTLSEKYGVVVQPVYFELTDTEAMKNAVQPILKDKDKTIDILVNNAGKEHGAFFCMTKMSDLRNIFEINLLAGMELTQLVLKKMIRQKSGAIINISSVAALHVRPGNSAYGVSKAAFKFWTEILAAEVAKYGIRANVVAPGMTDTDMAKLMEEKAGEDVLRASAMARLAKPQEIADAVAYLASDEASFVNGHTLVVDGGGGR